MFMSFMSFLSVEWAVGDVAQRQRAGADVDRGGLAHRGYQNSDAGIEILVSPMSKTAAVNVGPGALALGYVADGPLY